TAGVYAIALSPDGKILASGSSDGTVKLWSLSTRIEIATLTAKGAERSQWRCVAFSPDGKTIAASGLIPGATVHLWDVAAGRTKPMRTMPYSDEVYSIAFTPDGSGIVSGSARYRTATLWDVASGEQKAEFRGAESAKGIWSVIITPDGKTLAA